MEPEYNLTFNKDYEESLEQAIVSFNKNRDSAFYRYPEALELYCETSLSPSQIAIMLQLDERIVVSWVKTYKWEEMRQALFPKMDTQTLRYIEKKTIAAQLKHSRNIEEQLHIIGNVTAQEVYKRLSDPESISTMDNKDVLNFFTKVKDLEARVSGQMKTQSTQVVINNNSVYRKFVEQGMDDMFNDTIDIEVEEMKAPEPKRLPEHVTEKLEEYKERYTKLSDEEAAQYLGKEER